MGRALPLLVLAALATPVTGVAAQVRTRPVDVRWYETVAGLPLSVPAAGPGRLVALDCVRNVSPPFRPTRCREVPARVADGDRGLLAPISQCYGVAGAEPSPLPAPTVAALRRAFETSRSGSDRIAVALPGSVASLPPTLVLVRWRDVGRGMRCARWTRHCSGIDCNMTGARRFCAEDVEVSTHETNVEWGWVEDGAMRLTSGPPLLETGGRLLRFDSVTLDAHDTSVERATVGALAPGALRALARTTTDPVLRYAAWIDLAVDAWTAERDDDLLTAIREAAGALPDALAATPLQAHDPIGSALATLQRVQGYRGDGALGSPCGTSRVAATGNARLP